MKKFYTLVLTAISLCSHQISQAQCNGVKGPNLLGAKGTFSAPFITVNSTADACTNSGSNSFNPTGNVGNALLGCTSPGTALPCSDFTYAATAGGLEPEFTYSILKTIGDNTGGNCIKGDWTGRDHTGDGGYFMAVNGAPNTTENEPFYQVKSVAVCIGATYEFSAWVANLLPASSPYASPGSEPNISFKVNGTIIANSGPVTYNNAATWTKVSGTFVATTSLVNLEVINATTVAIGNDLGLDDISINVCQSQIAVQGPSSICSGNTVSINFVVTDINQSNTWYKWLKSVDGGITFTDLTGGAQASFTGSTYTLTNNLGIVNSSMNGIKYRLAVSTSQAGLSNPDCIYFNDYTVLAADCGPLPIQLTSFKGRYLNGKSQLDWQTSQEINNDHFDLMRSTDGVNFIKAGTVKGAGNSSTVKTYTYQDDISSHLGNFVYYRLKQVDIDKREILSAVVKLSMRGQTSFEVFPNPFNNNFTISFNALKSATGTLRIQSSTGNLVYSKTINIAKGNNSLMTSSLPSLGAGVYYVTVYNEELNLSTKLQKL